MKYTTSFRNSVLKKILPPSNRSVTSVSKETGVAVVTINNWLARLKEGKMSLDEDDENPSSMRNSREKLGVSRKTIERDMTVLQEKGLVQRVGSNKTGQWELVNTENTW